MNKFTILILFLVLSGCISTLKPASPESVVQQTEKKLTSLYARSEGKPELFYHLAMIDSLVHSQDAAVVWMAGKLLSDLPRVIDRMHNEYQNFFSGKLMNASYLLSLYHTPYIFMNNGDSVLLVKRISPKIPPQQDSYLKFMYKTLHQKVEMAYKELTISSNQNFPFDLQLVRKSITDKNGNLGYDSQKLDPFVWGMMNGFIPAFFERPGSYNRISSDYFDIDQRYITSTWIYHQMLDLEMTVQLITGGVFVDKFQDFRPSLEERQYKGLVRSLDYGFIDTATAMACRLWLQASILISLSREEVLALHSHPEWGRVFDLKVFNILKLELRLRAIYRKILESTDQNNTQGCLISNAYFLPFVRKYLSTPTVWPDYYREIYPGWDFTTPHISREEIQTLDPNNLELKLFFDY